MAGTPNLQCIICKETCSSKTCNLYCDDRGDDVDIVREGISVFLVLETVLGVPRDHLEKFIVKHGNPSAWGVGVCDSCKTAYIERAKDLKTEATAIDRRLNQLQSQATEHLQRSQIHLEQTAALEPNNDSGVKTRGKGKSKRKPPPRKVACPVVDEIRKWVAESRDSAVGSSVKAQVEAAGGVENYVMQLKAEKSFRTMGPGQRLVEGNDHEPGPSSTMSMANNNNNKASVPPSQLPTSSTSESPNLPSTTMIASEQKRAAAAAALARMEKKKKTPTDSDELLAARQANFIKEQARKELEADNMAMNPGSSTSTNELNEIPKKRVIDPASYAVQGVYYRCPELGIHDPKPKAEVENKIREHLMKQLKNEQGDRCGLACQIIYSCNKPVEMVTGCVETMLKYLENIVQNPLEPKFRKIRCTNNTFREKVSKVFGAEIFLEAVGFEKTLIANENTWAETEEEYWVFIPSDENTFTADLIECRDLLMTTQAIKPSLDRNVQILKLDQLGFKTELPDEFYNLTKEDIQREQLHKTEMAERELTLRTKAMRDREGIRESRIYRYAVIRVRFPDSIVLQGTFGAHEQVSNVLHFVRNNIVQSDLNFELILPGGGVLNDAQTTQTLVDLKLVPTSVVTFQMENPPTPLAAGEISYLKNLNPSLFEEIGQ